jgi:hypothetical protein
MWQAPAVKLGRYALHQRRNLGRCDPDVLRAVGLRARQRGMDVDWSQICGFTGLHGYSLQAGQFACPYALTA